MSRRKKGRRKRKDAGPTVSGPFAGTYRHLRRQAERRGLFVLFDGTSVTPRLTFFDTTRGVAILDYWPRTRLWSYADRLGRGGRCDEHADVIAVAVRRAGQRENSTKVEFRTEAS
jgi:hypothetical protein